MRVIVKLNPFFLRCIVQYSMHGNKFSLPEKKIRTSQIFVTSTSHTFQQRSPSSRKNRKKRLKDRVTEFLIFVLVLYFVYRYCTVLCVGLKKTRDIKFKRYYSINADQVIVHPTDVKNSILPFHAT